MNNLTKIMPKDLDSEKAVLGAILMEKNAIQQVYSILVPDSFYNQHNATIYETVAEMYAANEDIDLITVIARLRKKELLNDRLTPHYVTGLTDRVNSSAHIIAHAMILQEKYLKRRLVDITANIQDEAFAENDVFETLDSLKLAIDNLEKGLSRSKCYASLEAVQESLEIIASAMANKGIVGIPSGISTLDKITGGWRKGHLVIKAARPAMGKTASVLSYAYHAAMAGHPVAFFSLEMGKAELMNRLISMKAKDMYWMQKSSSELSRGMLDVGEYAKVQNAAAELAKLPIFIDDGSSLSPSELRRKAIDLKTKHNIQFIIIDYLQLMDASSLKKNKHEEISYIARCVKLLAKELEVPIILLSQLSRGVESRDEKRPVLSDLKESGGIEENADMVIMLYRDEYYGQMQNEFGESTANILEMIIRKNRHGALATVLARYYSDTNTIYDISKTIAS